MVAKRFVLLCLAVPALASEPMSVCQVMANLSALDGKQISVRGVWRRGDAGEVLWSALPCEHRTVRDGWEFVDAIQTGPLHGRQSAAGYYSEYREMASAHPGANILVTLLGVLRAPEHFEVWIDPWKIPHLRAFRSSFAAQMSYMRVSDFKAAPPPTETEDEIERRRHSEPRRLQ